jgi:ribonuclease D
VAGEDANGEGEPRRLDQPRDGVPEVITDRPGLERTLKAMRDGTGPIAVDAERASGHRYGQRAFLVQLRRDGAGTALIDPVALPDLTELSDVLRDVEWVLHAANQDLPCLADLGMRPVRLFDTELAARLAGYPRVGLAAMVTELLGLHLAKEHSAVDWSTRPLPEPWLRYAALDVEVLVELRDTLAADLERQGKLGWARQEFAALATAPPPPPRVDPWRRTSGIHRIRDRRRLAAVRELWTTRDRIAQDRDVSPGRILPDSAIIEAATAMPATPAALQVLPAFTGRGARRYLRQWQTAVTRAADLPEAGLPPQSLPLEGPPPPRIWAERDPAAAERLAACRATLAELAEELNLPVENLIQPETVRRLVWTEPDSLDPARLDARLRSEGARAWQAELVAGPLSEALIALAEAGPDSGYRAPVDDTPDQ